MESKIVRIANIGEQSETNELLRDAIKEEFDQVIILGLKEGKVYIRTTDLTSRIEILGMIEEIKYTILQSAE